MWCDEAFQSGMILLIVPGFVITTVTRRRSQVGSGLLIRFVDDKIYIGLSFFILSGLDRQHLDHWDTNAVHIIITHPDGLNRTMYHMLVIVFRNNDN